MRISDWSSDVCSSDLVIEFGTFPNTEVRTAIMIDRFLRLGRENRSAASHEELRARMLNGFVPRDPAWRANVVERSLDAHRRALAGVASWRSEEHTSELQSLMRNS